MKKASEQPSFKQIARVIARMYALTGDVFWRWGIWRLFGGFGSASMNLLYSRALGQMLDIAIGRDWAEAMGFITTIIVLTVLRSGLGFTNALSHYRYSTLSGHKLRRMLISKLHSLPIGYFENHHSGEVVSRVVNDVDRMQEFYGNTIAGIWSYVPVNIVMSLILLVGISWQLTLVCVVAVPLLSYAMTRLSLPLSKNSQAAQASAANYNAYLRDFLEGVDVYKIFALSKKHGGRFSEAVDAEAKEKMRAAKREMLIRVIGTINQSLPWLISYAVGGVFVARGQMTIGGLYAFAAILPQFCKTTWQVTENWTAMVTMAGRAKHFLDLLDTPGERRDGGDFGGKGGLEVRFENVSYTYPTGQGVLNECSFEVKNGSTAALVGASGGGKTTLFKLLCGYYPDYEGGIYINGHELSEWNLGALRARVAYVSQESYLFDTTILENIRLGRPDASDEDVMAAAKAAFAHDFILELENGYETRLGERGARLSGGQRQRVAIARAILKNAPLVLLDEPTAALDARSEFHVQEALLNLAKGRTVFVIAHRVSTIENADEILVLDGGLIRERGRHGDLARRGGRYIELYSAQIAKGGAAYEA